MNRYLTSQKKLVFKNFWILSLSLIVFLSFFYIFQINRMTQTFFLISNQEKEMANLSQQNKILEINLFKNDSLENVENLVKGLSFGKVENVHYIQIMESPVVTK